MYYLKLWKSIVFFLLGVFIMAFLEYYFLNAELIIHNLHITFYTIEIIFVTLNSILFWLFLALSFYKIEYFSVKKSWVWFIGSLFGIIVSGCPACSITLASYIGLAGILSTFPYQGIELKVWAFFLMLVANLLIYKDLKVCKISIKK